MHSASVFAAQPSNTFASTAKSKTVSLQSQCKKRRVHFNEIVTVGYTYSTVDYDRSSIAAFSLTAEDIQVVKTMKQAMCLVTFELCKERYLVETKHHFLQTQYWTQNQYQPHTTFHPHPIFIPASLQRKAQQLFSMSTAPITDAIPV